MKGGLCWIHWWSVEKELPVANWLLLETVGAGVCRIGVTTNEHMTNGFIMRSEHHLPFV